MQPLLSIVIPTKNRYEYLIILLQELLRSKNNAFEIIVQDNSDNNSNFLTFIKTIKDNRLFYNHTTEWLSVCDNCNKGVALTKGEFVCMIGDDDGILVEQSIKFCERMKANGIDAVLINACSYVWPDVIHAIWGNTLSGKLEMTKYTGNIININLERELNAVLAEGAGFGMGKLPRVYHGIISKSVLTNLWNKSGSYFPGPSPDMSNAIGLIPFTKKAVQLDFPLVISGHGAKSTGGQAQRKEHHGLIEKQSFLPKDTVNKWDHKIPYFWSGHTIWAESARRALNASGQEIKTNEINYDYLYASCFIYEHFHKKVFDAIKVNRNSLEICFTWIKIIYYLNIVIFKRALTFFKNKLKKNFNISSMTLKEYPNIGAAISAMSVYELEFLQNKT
jgi:glycosyltransferase involved in cell wall biosynthesis